MVSSELRVKNKAVLEISLRFSSAGRVSDQERVSKIGWKDPVAMERVWLEARKRRTRVPTLTCVKHFK